MTRRCRVTSETRTFVGENAKFRVKWRYSEGGITFPQFRSSATRIFSLSRDGWHFEVYRSLGRLTRFMAVPGIGPVPDFPSPLPLLSIKF
jgi:hypothetical protein